MNNPLYQQPPRLGSTTVVEVNGCSTYLSPLRASLLVRAHHMERLLGEMIETLNQHEKKTNTLLADQPLRFRLVCAQTGMLTLMRVIEQGE